MVENGSCGENLGEFFLRKIALIIAFKAEK